MSSTKNALFSLRGSTAAKNAPQNVPSVPPAFQKKSINFAPPPTRRVGTADSNPSANLSKSQDEELDQEAEATEESGEWAEALYEYSSEVSFLIFPFILLIVAYTILLIIIQDPGDLHLQAHQHVLVIEKTSDDW